MKEFPQLIETVLAAVRETRKKVAARQNEISYCQKLMTIIASRGLSVKSQPCTVVGENGVPSMVKWIDIVVESSLAIEVKTSNKITPRCKKKLDMLMENTGLKCGIIANFDAEDAELQVEVITKEAKDEKEKDLL